MMITIIKPSWEFVSAGPFEGMETHLELCGRTCYKSEDRINRDSAERFVRRICKNNHTSVLEHQSVSVRIICSRACSHQLVRHRLAAYSQESQRYCNYGKKGFQFIAPPSVMLLPGEYATDHYDWYLYPDEGEAILIPETVRRTYLGSLQGAHDSYMLLSEHIPPEDARYLLPNASKTEIVVTMNLRMWQHVFRERAFNEHAQWEIRGIFKGIFEQFYLHLPSVFGDMQ